MSGKSLCLSRWHMEEVLLHDRNPNYQNFRNLDFSYRRGGVAICSLLLFIPATCLHAGEPASCLSFLLWIEKPSDRMRNAQPTNIAYEHSKCLALSAIMWSDSSFGSTIQFFISERNRTSNQLPTLSSVLMVLNCKSYATPKVLDAFCNEVISCFAIYLKGAKRQVSAHNLIGGLLFLSTNCRKKMLQSLLSHSYRQHLFHSSVLSPLFFMHVSSSTIWVMLPFYVCRYT